VIQPPRHLRLRDKLDRTKQRLALRATLTADDLERRIEIALLHYLCFRPHEGLGGATPVEVFLGLEPAHLSAVEPPRGMPGEGRGEAPFRLAAFLDESSKRFPALTQAG